MSDATRPLDGEGLWYFAHPYTCKDKDGNYVQAGEEANFRICCIRSGELMKRGYNIYSPIAHTHPIHMATPDFLARHEHEMWYRLDNDFIAKTNWTGIILAPGWEKSSGCKAELEQFKNRGLPVMYYTQIVSSSNCREYEGEMSDAARPLDVKPDMVQHPPHYTMGGIEVLDAIEAWKLGYHEGNIVKYIARAKYKNNELEDLKKAAEYLRRLIALKEKPNAGSSV